MIWTGDGCFGSFETAKSGGRQAFKAPDKSLFYSEARANSIWRMCTINPDNCYQKEKTLLIPRHIFCWNSKTDSFLLQSLVSVLSIHYLRYLGLVAAAINYTHPFCLLPPYRHWIRLLFTSTNDTFCRIRTSTIRDIRHLMHT